MAQVRNCALICLILVAATSIFAQSPTKSRSAKSGTVDKSTLSATAISSHVQFLLLDVAEISTPGVPGPLCVYGPQAFPVLIDRKDGRNAVVIAAAEHGRGRMVALSHGGYLGGIVKEHPPTGKLVSHCVAWAANRQTLDANKTVIGVRGDNAVKELLRQAGATVKDLPNRGWTAELKDLQAVVAEVNDCNPQEINAIDDYIRQGGGIVSSNLIWGWLQGHAGADPLVDSPPNQLFSRAGLVWADGYAPSGYGAKIPVSAPGPDEGHVARSIDRLDEALAGKKTLSKEELKRVADSLIGVRNSIPADHDHGVLKRFDDMIARHAKSTPIPSEKSPVKPSELEQRIMVSLINQTQNSTPVASLKASPAAETFPGIPGAAAKRVTRKVEIDRSQFGWKSTGMYAGPRDKVTVNLDPVFVKSGCVLQIGCHSDDLTNNDRDAWKRMPRMVRRFPVNQATMEIGHSLGGLIYLDIPEKLISKETASIEIIKAVEAPYYAHEKTDPGDWRAGIRDFPGPWAELETRNLIITVPSELIRKLDFPDKLMDHWTRVVDACADLAAIPHERRKPERMVFDVQISAGYLHSGYPIMGHIKPTASEIVSLDSLMTQGGWGFYHELGHNHQQGPWTFDGTTEVTCNLFSLYVHEMLSPNSKTHDAVLPAHRVKLEVDYLKAGAKFEDWKRDPFLALVMYQQMQGEFGWEPFKKVFAEYRSASKDSLPKNDDEKRDQWMVRFSKTVGRNLGPFFQHWGIPTSEAARKSIEQLPPWMPAKPS